MGNGGCVGARLTIPTPGIPHLHPGEHKLRHVPSPFTALQRLLLGTAPLPRGRFPLELPQPEARQLPGGRCETRVLNSRRMEQGWELLCGAPWFSSPFSFPFSVPGLAPVDFSPPSGCVGRDTGKSQARSTTPFFTQQFDAAREKKGREDAAKRFPVKLWNGFQPNPPKNTKGATQLLQLCFPKLPRDLGESKPTLQSSRI